MRDESQRITSASIAKHVGIPAMLAAMDRVAGAKLREKCGACACGAHIVKGFEGMPIGWGKPVEVHSRRRCLFRKARLVVQQARAWT